MSTQQPGSASRVVTGLGFGIALGTLLGFFVLAPHTGGETGGGSSHQELEAATQAQAAAEGELRAADNVLDSVSGAAVADALRERTVAIVTLPGADPSSVEAMQSLVTRAGAVLTGTAALTPAAVDQQSGDDIKSIIAKSLPEGATLSEQERNPGMHTGQVLGAILSSRNETDRSVGWEALKQGGYVEGELPKPVGEGVEKIGVIVVDGNPAGVDEAARAYHAQFAADLASGLDSSTAGAVLAEASTPAAPGEQTPAEQGDSGVDLIRADRARAEQVSTVDSAQRVAGRIATVRAVAEQFDGKAGHYGARATASRPTP